MSAVGGSGGPDGLAAAATAAEVDRLRLFISSVTDYAMG